MTPDMFFDIASPLAMLGWIGLALAPLAPIWVQRISGLAIPVALSVVYTGLVLVYWPQSDGGYGSLDDVMSLLGNRGMATAGWVHYLAFDLLVGAWIAHDARTSGIRHLFILPSLVLTFLFGPVGFVTYLALKLVAQPKQDAMFEEA